VQPELIYDAQAMLGEGPAWEAETNTLYWVDILHRRIHYHREGENSFFPLDEMPGCVAPAKDGTLLVAARAAFIRYDPATSAQTVLSYVREPAGNRFNDGKCDPAGRFLAGTMDMEEKKASGALYSFHNGEVTCLLESVRISNGLAWSPDFKTFYHTDTPTREVKAFDYNLESGQIANPRVVIRVPDALGWPDGMTSDTNGCLWIGMWGGGQVTRWDPSSGSLLAQIPFPARNVTSCVFGGEDLDELYVTSARAGLDENDLAKYPSSGSLMRVRAGVQGMPTFKFG